MSKNIIATIVAKINFPQKLFFFFILTPSPKMGTIFICKTTNSYTKNAYFSIKIRCFDIVKGVFPTSFVKDLYLTKIKHHLYRYIAQNPSI